MLLDAKLGIFFEYCIITIIKNMKKGTIIRILAIGVEQDKTNDYAKRFRS